MDSPHSNLAEMKMIMIVPFSRRNSRPFSVLANTPLNKPCYNFPDSYFRLMPMANHLVCHVWKTSTWQIKCAYLGGCRTMETSHTDDQTIWVTRIGAHIWAIQVCSLTRLTGLKLLMEPPWLPGPIFILYMAICPPSWTGHKAKRRTALFLPPSYHCMPDSRPTYITGTFFCTGRYHHLFQED